MNYELAKGQWKGVFGSNGVYRRGFTGDDFMLLWFTFWAVAPIAIILWIIL